METSLRHDTAVGAQSLRRVDARLRNLDIDDLYLLSFLGDGKRLTDAARALRLSQPAITQRIHKIENSLKIDILERSARATRLTEQGLHVCRRSIEAISFLEKFFDGDLPPSEVIAVTGAWAAWLVTGVLGSLSDSNFDLVDVEYVSPESMIAAARHQDGFAQAVATLHMRSLEYKIQGYSTVASIVRPVTLWCASSVNTDVLKRPLPLIEVSRDEKLVDEQTLYKIEKQVSFVRGVKYAGTVAGAYQLALNGQGVLLLPVLNLDDSMSLKKLSLDIELPSVCFDLLVDERAPVVEIVNHIIGALK
jgi:DNA-binding transcriptional LysR family regulator